ncbi:ribosome small subunit-dependent GTPase A [Bacillus testis]|uniref:ribosome small subunit-dependent GTPase A n=1 Tax=Bacillus testis TaxID=1622072 RepID=UPI00067E6AD8|nr:ribosome small subunit-dependent GTPase A [Bacillus testis]
MTENRLEQIGFDCFFQQEAARFPHLFAAKVSSQHKEIYKVIGQQGEMQAKVAGKLSYSAFDARDFPAVGDWVMVDREQDSSGDAIIHHILPRKSIFERNAAGLSNDVQIIATNIDVIFICMSVNSDFNLRRLERYLAVAWDSGSTPVVVLTKADLCEDIGEKWGQVNEVAIGAEVIAVSSMQEEGVANVKAMVPWGKSAAFIGSSGVGKSTLINSLMEAEVLAVNNIREEDDKGRHTTTHRQLLLLPGGGAVIDTPGMRELKLESGDLSHSFADIEEYARQCRFSDCSHLKEPGCAVKEAIADGSLPAERFSNYLKLQRELHYQEMKANKRDKAKAVNMSGNMNAMKKISQQIKRNNKKR